MNSYLPKTPTNYDMVNIYVESNCDIKTKRTAFNAKWTFCEVAINWLFLVALIASIKSKSSACLFSLYVHNSARVKS